MTFAEIGGSTLDVRRPLTAEPARHSSSPGERAIAVDTAVSLKATSRARLRSHDRPPQPTDERHQGALRERVCMEDSGRIGRELRRRVPLEAYLPQPQSKPALDMRNLRRALLERMGMMASKGLVREMLVDLRSAGNVRPHGKSVSCSADEARVCMEVGSLPFFQRRLLDSPDRIVVGLVAAAGSGPGKEILARIARGLLHAARRADRPSADRQVLLRCALRLFLASGLLRAARAYLPARPRA